ncbi:EAL domain-containing protein, partial [Klebsiella pneumoniae]|nr:EAL domain-containing protein [Klebsiella pneumoniae]
AGVRIALDDFGTGNLPLGKLKELPVSSVKMDKVFIDEIGQSESQEAIAESIISLGHKLNMEMVAKGVDNQEQLDYLIKEKCDNIQG